MREHKPGLLLVMAVVSLVLASACSPASMHSQPAEPPPTATPQPTLKPSPAPKPTPAREPAATQTATPTTEELRVHFIDVGQGDSILIDHGETEVLIDGGNRASGVASYLDDYVDGALEVMVATHPDDDHIGGLIGVLSAFEVRGIWLNGDESSLKTHQEFMSLVKAEGAAIHEAQCGDSIKAGNLTLTVLHPAGLFPKSTNNNSIVLLLSYGDMDFLFTGDAQTKAEEAMLAKKYYPVPDVDFLKVGCHGSRFSSSARFLDRVRPEFAIYMAGEGNRECYPHEETISALSQIGAKIYGTDIHGTITVITDGHWYRLQLEKEAAPLAPPAVSSTPPPTPPPSPTPTNQVVEFSLDVEIKPPGAGTVILDPPGGVYPKGTVVRANCTAKQGYEFVQWTVDGMPVPFPEVFVTMDSDKTVIIYFKRTGW